MEPKLAGLIPPEVISLLGLPPVKSEADLAIYYATVGAFAKDINPRDVITWFLIKDLTDHRIDIAFYRRLKALALLEFHSDYVGDQIKAIESHHRKKRDDLNLEAKAKAVEVDKSVGSERQKKLAKTRIEQKLQDDLRTAHEQCNTDVASWKKVPVSDSILSRQWSLVLLRHKQLDEVLDVAERRFASALREIERHVGGFGQRLRENLDKIIEEDAIEIDSGETPLVPT
jgi:hypothetical protein